MESLETLDCGDMNKYLHNDVYLCYFNRASKELGFYINGYASENVYIILKKMCINLLGLVGFFLLLHPRFRNKHPYSLLGCQCIFQSLMYFNCDR